MQQIEVERARESLPELIDRAMAGDEVLITRDHRPLVRLVRAAPTETSSPAHGVPGEAVRQSKRPRPLEVRPLPNYRLWLRYDDGVEGEVDLSHLVGRGVFSRWTDYRQFERVHIGSGSAIEWDDEVDVCADSLYLRITGKTPEQVFPGLRSEPLNA